MAKERKYYAAAAIDHDGKRHEVGAEMVGLSEDAAKPLLAVKAITTDKPSPAALPLEEAGENK